MKIGTHTFFLLPLVIAHHPQKKASEAPLSTLRRMRGFGVVTLPGSNGVKSCITTFRFRHHRPPLPKPALYCREVDPCILPIQTSGNSRNLARTEENGDAHLSPLRIDTNQEELLLWVAERWPLGRCPTLGSSRSG